MHTVLRGSPVSRLTAPNARRTGLLGLASATVAAAFLFAAGCRSHTVDASPATPRPNSEVEVIDVSLPRTTIAAASPADAAAVVAATYRVRPDRRFLRATGDIYALTTGKHGVVRMDFAAGRWLIKCDGRDVGELPDLPTFSDAAAMLAKWSAALRGAASAHAASQQTLADIDRDLSSMQGDALFHGLRSIGAPSSADAALLARATRALTLLNLQTTDRFGLSDPLRARALALLSMTRADDPNAVPEDMAAVAYLMGYEREARALGSTLPDRSFARMLIFGTTGAVLGQSDLAQQYVAASVAISKAKGVEPERAIGPWISTLRTRAVPLLLQETAFESTARTARVVAGVIASEVENPDLLAGTFTFGGTEDWLDALEGKLDLSRARPAEMIRGFEAALPKRIAAVSSSVATPEVVRSFHESRFYSALYEEFRFYLKDRASRDDTTSFIESLDTTAPLSSQIRQWMATMSTATFDGGKGLAPEGIVKGTPLLSPGRTVDALSALGNAIGNADLNLRLACNVIYPQLDSRPEELYRAGRLSMFVLGDPFRRDRYINAALSRAPGVAHPGDLSWFYFSTGNGEALQQIADDPNQAPVDRVSALDYLTQLGGPDKHDSVYSRIEQLLRETRSLPAFSAYAGLLNRHKDWRRKERAARDWFAASPEATPIERSYYASSLGDALEHQGRYEEAWKVVQPHIDVWSANVIGTAVSLLERRGLRDEANDLGRQLVDRYPGAGSRADFAAVLWRQHRYADAAALFSPKAVRISRQQWNWWVPDTFVDAFGKDAASAVAAFNEFIRAGVDGDLLETVPGKFLERGEPATAYALAERLVEVHPPTAHDSDAASHLILAFRALKAASGAPAAHVWLRAHVPDSVVLALVGTAYGSGEYDLVSEVAAPRVVARKEIELESYLASALTQMRVPHEDPRWIALTAATRAEPDRPGSLLPVNRYLANLIDERVFMAAAKDAEWRSTVAYFVGLRAAEAGDYDRALPLLLMAAQGPKGHPPTICAASLLYKWDSVHATWDEVKKQRVF